MAGTLRLFAFLLLLCFGPVCRAQEITVRVINVNTGRPLPKQPVTVAFLYDKNYDKTIPPNHARGLHLETDANGEARFTFPEPAPVHFSAELHVDWSRWNCGCGVTGSTDDLLAKGMVTSIFAAPKPVPGQILFVAWPLSFFQRLLYPLTKE